MDPAKKIVDIATEHFSSSVWGYYNLWSYFDNKLKHKLASRRVHSIKYCLEYYDGIRNGAIKHGDKILLSDFFLCEWVPRAAGGLAHFVHDNHLDIEKYYRIPTSFRHGVKKMKEGDLIPPMGSVRFPLAKKKDIILGLVTPEEYHVDMGIPVAVSTNVYSEFLSKQIGTNAVEVTLEGYVDLFSASDELPMLPEISEDVKNNSISVPSVILRVSSPIQIKFRSHNSHPRMNAWFLRRTENEENKMVGMHITTKNGKRTIKKIYADLVEYDYFYWTIFENNSEELSLVREMMKKNFHGFSTEGDDFDQMDKDAAYELLGKFPIGEIEMKDYSIKKSRTSYRIRR